MHSPCSTRSTLRLSKALLVAALCGHGACGLGNDTLEQDDPAALPQTVTYARHVRPRMEHYCTGCHSPDSQIGTAGGWDFSSYALTRASFASIDAAALRAATMPPGGARKLSSRDIAIFRRWKAQGFLP